MLSVNYLQVVVRTLRELLQWVMGIPAGLKFNYAFNNMLGQFFLYHINLWWTFLGKIKNVTSQDAK
jgi:phosphatidylinositol glycan class Q protein